MGTRRAGAPLFGQIAREFKKHTSRLRLPRYPGATAARAKAPPDPPEVAWTDVTSTCSAGKPPPCSSTSSQRKPKPVSTCQTTKSRLTIGLPLLSNIMMLPLLSNIDMMLPLLNHVINMLPLLSHVMFKDHPL